MSALRSRPEPLDAHGEGRRAPHAVEPQGDASEHADAAAMERLARGEIHALGEIYERHHAAVRRFAARATGDASDAADIVHDTFLTVPRAARHYDGRASCRPWLLGIAARLIQRRGRSLGRLARMLGRFSDELRQRPADAVSPERAAVVGDDLAALQAALLRLSEAKRVVLLMAEVEGMSGDEIAAALDIPIGTVWTRLHHARNDLQKTLARRRSTP